MMHLPVTAEDQIQQEFLVSCSYPSRLLRRQASRLQKPEISFLESLGHSEVIQVAMWKPATLCEVTISTFPFYTEKGQHKIGGLQEASTFKHPTLITPTNAGSKITGNHPVELHCHMEGKWRVAAHNLSFINACSIISSAIKINIVVLGVFFTVYIQQANICFSTSVLFFICLLKYKPCRNFHSLPEDWYPRQSVS